MIRQLSILFAVELTKLKRSQSLLMTFLCPLSVVGLQFLMVLEGSGELISEKGWSNYWYGAIGLWYMLMLPLYVALITTLVNGLEHKHNGWRLMATLPIRQWQLYVVKGVIGWLFVLIASILMYVFTSASIVLMTLMGYQSEATFSSPFLTHLAKVMIAALPIIMIGHLISWRIKNIVFPLAIGVIMTIVANTVARSEYWFYDPWAYHIIATLGAKDGVNMQALILGGALGICIYALSAWRMGKREVYG